jgi:hypothetical protein
MYRSTSPVPTIEELELMRSIDRKLREAPPLDLDTLRRLTGSDRITGRGDSSVVKLEISQCKPESVGR